MTERKKLLAEQIREDYRRRSEQRRALEAQWRLNANFVAGKQYCAIAEGGAIIQQDKRRLWEERAVYNHTASILETRLAKLSKVRPKITVEATGNSESAISQARLSSAVIDGACKKINLGELISEATMWSELTGTAFYKISWDKGKGMIVGKINGEEVRDGDVRVDVCPPYEIFPDSIYHRSVERCQSIIHAKAVSLKEIYAAWGITPNSESDSLQDYSALTGIFMSQSEALGKNYALVIERFTRPSVTYPNGRYEVVVGDTVAFEGDLPYINGEDGQRDLPFVRQCCTLSPGGFFGISPIERAIPIQKAYNAVKNRKHEFMNRIATGVLAVEDGSVDVDELIEDGLEPGKVLVYRQGCAQPTFLDTGDLPGDFSDEEDKLMEEMARVSGVSEFMRSSALPSVTSGNALRMLIEQDDSRLAVTADQITAAVKAVGKHMLRLYKQLAGEKRLSKIAGKDGQPELIYWKASGLDGEVCVAAPPEISETDASRVSILMELVKSGLLDKFSEGGGEVARQILGELGYETQKDVGSLHRQRADKENRGEIRLTVKPYDDHAIHLKSHVAYLLENAGGECLESELESHVAQHEEFIRKQEEL